MNCHMDAMCSARARALVQDLTSDDVENEEKYGKIGEKYRCLWRIHNSNISFKNLRRRHDEIVLEIAHVVKGNYFDVLET